MAVLLVCTCTEGVLQRRGGCTNDSQNIADLLETNTTITLENGTYCIERFVPVENKPRFSLSSKSGNPQDVIIRCSDGVGLGFHNITDHFELSGVTISGCGIANGNLTTLLVNINQTLSVYYNAVPDTYFAIVMAAVHDVTFQRVWVNHNSGFGLLAISLYGNSTFSEVEFSNNISPSSDVVTQVFANSGNLFGGGAVFHYHDWITNPDSIDRVTLTIAKSRFSKNINQYSAELVTPYFEVSPSLQAAGYIFSGAAGITIKLCQQHYGVDFVVRDSDISENQAQSGGGATISTSRYAFRSNITFLNCNFSDNHNSTQSSAAMGLGLTLDLWYWNSTIQQRGDRDVRIMFDSCRFTGNVASSGGAVLALFAPGGIFRQNEDIVFHNCVFHQNQAASGAAITAYTFQGVALDPSHRIAFDGCVFSSNTVTASSTVSASMTGSGVIQLRNALIVLKDTVIRDSSGSGLQSLDSAIVIEGDVMFTNNSAVYGGGAQLIGFSYFVATNHSRLTFHRNTAFQSGGAVYFSLPQNFLVGSGYFDCFLYLNSLDPFCVSDCTLTGLDFVLAFQNNSADQGSMIHGALLDTCIWSYNLTEPYGPGGYNKSHTVEYVHEHFSHMFQFDQPLGPTGVNTNAHDSMVNVDFTSSTTAWVMPGQEFAVSGNSVDLLGNPVSDVLLAVIVDQHYVDNNPIAKARVGPNGLWRIRGNSSSVLRVDGPVNFSTHVSLTSSISQASSIVFVNLTECRPGFKYNNSSSRCECDPNLVAYGGTNFICNATDATFSVRLTHWFGELDGRDSLGSDVNSYVIALCGSFACDNPFYRVRTINVTRNSLELDSFQYVDPQNLSMQCLQNRHGLLCGRCKQNYSIVLGTLECRECDSNTGLLLILLFAVMGILLMATVIISDFHVSGGYINGLVFYSNIIDIFYLQLVKRNVPYNILILFEWLSLRWGIPMCFAKGMDSLTHVGLEFVFPIYIILLLLIIIAVARYCPIPQKYRNAVNLPKMFATTLFLTFGAILGTSVQILSFVVIRTASNNNNNTISVRWRRDPNVLYFQDAGHIILGLMSIVAIVYLVILTLLVITPERFCRLKWCRRKQRYYKPIIDVFQAPFRESYICRTWEGWRLLFRVLIIFIGFAPISIHIWILVLVLTIFLYFQSTLHPYKGQVRNWLDSLFVLILVITFLFYIGLDNFDIPSDSAIFLGPFYTIQSIVWCLVAAIFLKCFFRCLKRLYRVLKKCLVKGKMKSKSHEFHHSEMIESTTINSIGKDKDIVAGESVIAVEEDVQIRNYNALREGLLVYDSDDDEK